MKKEYDSPEFKKYSINFQDTLAVSISEVPSSTGVVHPTGEDDWEEDGGL